MTTIFREILFLNRNNLFYIFSFLSIISSINVSPYEILELSNFVLNLYYFNGLRILLFLITSILIIYKFINKFKFIYWKNFKNKILLILFINFFIQIISIFLNYEIKTIINEPKLVHGLYLNYSAIIVCLFFLLIDNEKIFLQITLLFGLSLFIFYFPLSLILLFDWITNDLSAMYFSNIIRHGTFFLDTPMPRSTGVARILLLFFIISLAISNKYPKHKINNFLLFLFAFLIISFQSRFSIYMLPIIILLFEILRGFKLKNILKKIILLLVIPYILSNSVGFIKLYLKIDINSDGGLSLNAEENKKDKLTHSQKIVKIQKLIRQGNRSFYGLDINSDGDIGVDTEVITSGRITIWEEIIDRLNSRNFFIGFGAHSDRLLLNDGKYKNFGNNASNIYLYSAFTGGIFSLILIIFLNLIIIYKIYNNFTLRKTNYILSTIVIITFFTRGLLEISYGFFGIDLLIILHAYQYFFYKSKLEK